LTEAVAGTMSPSRIDQKDSHDTGANRALISSQDEIQLDEIIRQFVASGTRPVDSDVYRPQPPLKRLPRAA
jgi:hypothetical protein